MSVAKPAERATAAPEIDAPGDTARPPETVQTLRERDIWLSVLLSTTAIGDGDKVLGTRLSVHHNFTTGQCNPSYVALARGTGKTLSAIPKQLKRLENGGFIRRKGSKGRHSNSYELILPSGTTADAGIGSTRNDGMELTSDQGAVSEESNPRPIDRVTPAPGAVEPYPAIQTNREENNEKNREREKYLSEHFEEFWKQYPKRVDRGAARKAFDRAITKHRATFEQIMAGVYRYAAERADQEPKFTKHASTWLNNDCWLDEPQPMAPPRTSRADSTARGMSRVDSAIRGLFSGLHDEGVPRSRRTAREGFLGDLTPEDFIAPPTNRR